MNKWLKILAVALVALPVSACSNSQSGWLGSSSQSVDWSNLNYSTQVAGSRHIIGSGVYR